MAERQSLNGKAKVLQEAATMLDEVLVDHYIDLQARLPEAPGERSKAEIRVLMGRVSFEMAARGLEVPQFELVGAAA